MYFNLWLFYTVVLCFWQGEYCLLLFSVLIMSAQYKTQRLKFAWYSSIKPLLTCAEIYYGIRVINFDILVLCFYLSDQYDSNGTWYLILTWI